jgi:hypothetical protein
MLFLILLALFLVLLFLILIFILILLCFVLFAFRNHPVAKATVCFWASLPRYGAAVKQK